ncbi:MAG: cytochrome c nitrite reductase small subunit [Planctomycetes bacterium]|nr:cytochrome c nitrite reductase small subunit [Planctomycetota bacterium]
MRPSIRRRWVLVVLLAALVGVTGGVGGFTFVYAKGASYLGNDPQTCANCHVMREHLDAWTKSSHRSVATCNDCHAPDDVLGKYATKGRNGLLHSVAFTTGEFPDPLRIKPGNLAIAEANCRRCHETLVDVIDRLDAGGPGHDGSGLSCTACHKHVGHSR